MAHVYCRLLTPGGIEQRLRTYQSNLALILRSLTVLYLSVVIRDTNQDTKYQVLFAGPEVQFDALKAKQSIEAVQAEVERITNRSDLKIKNITWQGEWR